VVDRLRLLWNRPLDDGDRLRLFAIAVALLFAVAATLSLLERPAPPQSAPRPETSPATAPTAAEPLPAPASTPTDEGSRTPVPIARTDVAASKGAARRFLAGYLPFTYGRSPARRIPAATPVLRRRLKAERPRVPAAERRRTPRLELLQSHSIGRTRAELIAIVDDGKRRYTVPLELARGRAGWQVARVGG